MVSFWPFKSGEDAASFERTLSTLTGKISRAAARNDGLRQKSRKVRVMLTLYAGFAYILAALLLVLVTGWRNWGAVEVSVISGGPVLIYSVRTALTTFFDWRISSNDAYIQKLTKERDATIDRLKEATKYNSTQQLLEKYGTPPKPKGPASPPSRQKSQGPQKQAQPQGPRTGMAPPPTANIKRPTTPQRPVSAGSSQGPPPPQALPPPDAPGAEFAPNAFTPAELTRQYSASAASTFTQPHWYDRILDALLGEDETQPKNRFALICSECRLVNGQAPPGTRTLEDVGRWKCGGCNAWNGKEKSNDDKVAELVKGWEDERRARERNVDAAASWASYNGEAESEDEKLPEEENVEEPEETRPLRSTRSKNRGKGKK